MPDFSSLPYSDLLTLLYSLTPKGDHVYLVGGGVRDLLLNEQIHDLDFTVEGNPFATGRRLADKLDAAFYIMDEEHPTSRVLHRLPDDTLLTIDFAALRADDIEADLLARDFTINAIAIALDRPNRLIDPSRGALDIKGKKLKACSPTSFSDDPIRVLRAIRQSLQFSFRIEPQSQQWMHQAAPQLDRISTERQRDELFKMLAGPNPVAAIRLLDQFGAAEITLPELGPLKTAGQSPPYVLTPWEHTLATLKWLEALSEVLVGTYQSNGAANLNLGLAVLRLGRFREQLALHFDKPITADRPRRALLSFAMLYHHIGKQTFAPPLTSNIEHEDASAGMVTTRARHLALSQAEIRYLETLTRHQERIHRMVAINTGNPPDCLSIYNFFRDLDAAGIDLCFLSLADTMATYMTTLPQDRWAQELDTCRHLLEAWWERKTEAIAPTRLLTGHDLQSRFSLPPGPSIGLLLEAIREAQVCGKLIDKVTALEFAAKWLENQG
jgi:tRNA nucleotidyltransferase/poly(A) polymerase